MDNSADDHISVLVDHQSIEQHHDTDSSAHLSVVNPPSPSTASTPAGPKKIWTLMKASNDPSQLEAAPGSELDFSAAKDSKCPSLLPKSNDSAPKHPTQHPAFLSFPAFDHAHYLAERINNILHSLLLAFVHTLKSVTNILSIACVILQTPITVIFTIYCLLWLASCLLMRVESALSPICATPILPNILPFCAHYQGIKLAEAPLADFQQLIAIQSGLQTVVEKQGDLSLSHTIRKSEVAVRDLTARIRFSQLDSKDALVGQLESFSAGAQDAAEGLESLASRVGGSLDIIISMDEFALKRLERIERDGIAFGSQMFNMMALRSTESMRLRQRQELASSFERALAFTGKQLKQLVSDATVVLNVLRRLDKIQNTVHEIITEENNTIKNEGEELLAQLWTILGGNRAEVALFKENRDLLAKLFRFHNAARDQVVNTIGQLRMLSGALSELRDRVALPVDHGADGLIPFEVHLESLRRGVEKLEVFRIQTNDRENQQLRHMLIEPLPESQQIGSA